MSNKMRVVCLHQENALTKQQKLNLEFMIKDQYAKYFGGNTKFAIVWTEIGKGQAFTAGRPSKTTTVMVDVPDGTDDEKRHAFMASACQHWVDITGCDRSEIILSVPDQALSNIYTEKSLNRINQKTRRFYLLKMLLKLCLSKVFRGHMSMSNRMR